ncbi:MAG: hypothetical protein ABFD92_01285 [Planctomycetaceae bacterium]|nr:hypothetical protein [Planctomycetaceae bacterium]
MDPSSAIVRLTGLAILCIAAAGCAGGGFDVLMDQQQASQAGVRLDGPIALDEKGCVHFLSKNNVWRFDRAKGSIEQETQKVAKPLVDLAIGDDGIVLVLDEGQVYALAAGSLVPVATIPGRAYKLAVARECLYVATRRDGRYQVLRYRLGPRRLEPVLRSDSAITALCPLPDGLLVGVGESIFKVSLPHRCDQPSAAEVQTTLICAIFGAQIQSIAADSQRRIFYFSDGAATFFWTGGAVRELLPAGGTLATRGDRLAICSPAQGQLSQLPQASKTVLRITQDSTDPGKPNNP